jgi:ribonucleoside-diphosphate reductase alpha chain
MARGDKILVTEQGTFDFSSYKWDDHLFSDLLIKENQIDGDRAMDISKALQEEIHKMELHTITIPLLEKIVEAKLLEYGLKKPSPIRLDTSMFVKEELSLSENAKTVLERRYLRKDAKGRLRETPVQMFRRVARHIARAEKKFGDESQVKNSNSYPILPPS